MLARPPQGRLSIIQKLIAAYKLWNDFLPHITKSSKYTLGAKIDVCFLSTLEFLFIASYLSKSAKVTFLQKAIAKLDLLKFFLQILWEIKGLDTKKYIALSEHLNEVGKMLGGWYKQTQKETPAAK